MKSFKKHMGDDDVPDSDDNAYDPCQNNNAISSIARHETAPLNPQEPIELPSMASKFEI